MDSQKIDMLVHTAQRIMTDSKDPIHDIAHVRRVVGYAQELGEAMQLGEDQQRALILAAWWHDAGRTITKRPSMIVMPFFDDIISALMLWRETIRCRLFGKVVGMATRMIFCKSLGTGKILSKVLMRKQNRIMIDLLKDADTLDMLSIERSRQLYLLVDSSWIYSYGYKMVIWWTLSSNHLTVKTHAAKKRLLQLLELFVAWIKKQQVFNWHVTTFGRSWTTEQINKGERLLQSLTQSFAHSISLT
ncbi:MAG: hypothetical protein COU33_00170 [Candidatus Magasanikbacteria bacterium CG10_big_fil_rev_8_21_14_0_10_43_6]|uniref:HD domain-containing protein n=1 Tax=Candidatus Magasanikbacteria bacterium CG10_big_fil_rev_8_21_14_0_10_43_6 TaxID=1974650 RepID=A0A2M6W2G5_9BACT|nr:MAG: hypothetical protein COU33_00170 [Candidatus Magasanikbacteria bacterium CG10_big_fil_rev_8_21_14_0_10_43_6]